jgi:hypothetical protein
VTEGQTWNDGQLGRAERQKRALMRKIRLQDGCWVWTGELGVFENPIVRLGADAVSAASMVWAVWRRSQIPASARPCRVNAKCVRPECWERQGG